MKVANIKNGTLVAITNEQLAGMDKYLPVNCDTVDSVILLIDAGHVTKWNELDAQTNSDLAAFSAGYRATDEEAHAVINEGDSYDDGYHSFTTGRNFRLQNKKAAAPESVSTAIEYRGADIETFRDLSDVCNSWEWFVGMETGTANSKARAIQAAKNHIDLMHRQNLALGVSSWFESAGNDQGITAAQQDAAINAMYC